MILVVEPQIKYTKIYLFDKDRPAFSVSFFNSELTEKNLAKKISAISKNKPIEAIGFRILFGADYFKKPVLVNSNFLKSFDRIVDFFPSYVPHAKHAMSIFYQNFRKTPLIAFFETAFFTKLAEAERYYAIPYQYHAGSKIKKFGFHGIFHESAGGLFPKSKKIISIVLDKVTTVCAVRGAKPLTVSLGYTPLEGIMSRTSCGDLDPGIAFYLLDKAGYSLFKLDSILKNNSGFTGLTGYDLSFEQFAKLYGKDERVDLAFEIYQNQILKYIGEGIAIMGGVDAIVFSGCFLDTLQLTVYNLLRKIAFLGISLEKAPWDCRKELTQVNSYTSEIEVWLNRRSIEKTIFLLTCENLRRFYP
jgi:acetate kinase